MEIIINLDRQSGIIFIAIVYYILALYDSKQIINRWRFCNSNDTYYNDIPLIYSCGRIDDPIKILFVICSPILLFGAVYKKSSAMLPWLYVATIDLAQNTVTTIDQIITSVLEKESIPLILFVFLLLRIGLKASFLNIVQKCYYDYYKNKQLFQTIT